MSRPVSCPGPTRRDLLRFGSVAVASTALGPLTSYRTQGATAPQSSNDPAVIFVWLPGGGPHMETFDMKPDAPVEYRGEFNPINTNVPGIQVCEHLPLLAKHADKYALIRSISHTFSDHGGGHKRFLTGRDPFQPVGFVNDHPMVGSMAAEVLKHKKAAVPNYVCEVDGGRQGIDVFSFGSAYLSTSTHPFMVVGDPSEKKFEIKNLSLLQGTEQKLPDRLGLLDKLDRGLTGADIGGHAAGMTATRQRALELVTTDAARDAFDLSKEPEKLREKYGMHRFGQRAILARRLVEHGASWVSVVMENPAPPGKEMPKDTTYNWDCHAVNCHLFTDTKYKLGFLDQAIATLIEDLYARGLDRRVLLVVTGEFGHTPRINSAMNRPGRDHWPQAMSVLVSGGGYKMGQTIGSTNAKGEHPKDRPMTPNDLWASVFRHLDIDYNRTEFKDGTGRPMPMLPYGNPIVELG